jgi:hypothetical protein
MSLNKTYRLKARAASALSPFATHSASALAARQISNFDRRNRFGFQPALEWPAFPTGCLFQKLHGFYTQADRN